MADSSKALDEFLGDVLDDLMRAGGRRAVRQAAKAFRKGTSYRFALGVSGSADAALEESAERSSGLQVTLRPGAMVREVAGGAAGGFARGRAVAAAASGGLQWWAELEIVNAVALDEDDGDDG